MIDTLIAFFVVFLLFIKVTRFPGGDLREWLVLFRSFSRRSLISHACYMHRGWGGGKWFHITIFYMKERFSMALATLCCYSHVVIPGQGWVGWKNDTRNGQPVEIKFEFDRVREFTAVHIFCNNQFTRDVQVSLNPISNVEEESAAFLSLY